MNRPERRRRDATPSSAKPWKTDIGRLLFETPLSKRLQHLYLALILIALALVRLAIIDTPALDRTYWKEIDYITISRNYLENGFDFLHPEIEWPAEPPRATAMELPVVPFAAGILYMLFGFSVYTVRMIPLLSYLLMSFYLFLLVRRELGPMLAVLGAAVAAILPLYHQFGVVLLSEPLMIACSVGSLYHLAEWADRRRTVDLAASALCFSLAVALKLTPLYLLLPLTWILYRKLGLRPRGYAVPVAAFLAALVIPALWYWHAYRLASESIDVFGVFGGHDKMQTLTMLSDIGWYRTMFFRIYIGILGGKDGAVPAFLGLIAALLFARRTGLFIAYFAAILAFFALVAEGQIDAPYRQLTIVPVASTLVAVGVAALAAIGAAALAAAVRALTGKSAPLRLKTAPVQYRHLLAAVSALSLGIMALTTAPSLFGRDPTAPVSDTKWNIAGIVREHTRPTDPIVTAGEYTIHKGGNDLSPVLYYYANRRGWSLQQQDWDAAVVEDLKEKGAVLFIAMDMNREPELREFSRLLKQKYRILHENTREDVLVLCLRC